MPSILDSHFSSFAPRAGQRELDYATVAGAVAAFALVMIAIVLGGGASSFLDLKSFLIVIGGTLGATLVNFSLEDFSRSIAVLRPAFYPDRSSINARINKILNMSRRARAEGLLVLEGDSYSEPDPFMAKSIELLVDGLPPEDIRQVLEIELSFLEDRHRRGAQLFQTMGTIAPAMGLIGTLIGLVQMLKNLDDPSQIGPAMAVALLTTFYGALLANILFLPLAGKLRNRSEEEALIKEVTIEGIVSVAKEVNPRLIEQRLLGFVAPEERRPEYR